MHRKLIAVIGTLFWGAVVNGAEIKIQPGPFPDGMDTWYGSTFNKDAVHDNRLRIGGWGDRYDTLVRFDLSGLPQTASQAFLYLYGIPAGGSSKPTPIKWYRLTTQWQSGTVSWNNRPTGSFLGYSGAPSGQSVWYKVNITSYYNQWRSGNPSTLNYGLALAPQYINNRFDIFHSSSSSLTGARPLLYLVYTPQPNDNVLKLKWPLATAYARRVPTQRFGMDWSTGKICGGLVKKHNGTDFRASAGTVVYAAEDGIVREVHYDSGGLYAYNVVIEHNHPQGGKYTTVCWHINPSVKVGDSVPKGMQIAKVANLGAETHFHFGVRIGSYSSAYLNGIPFAGTGSLPQTNCEGYPAFPAGFIDPNNTSNVLFH